MTFVACPYFSEAFSSSLTDLLALFLSQRLTSVATGRQRELKTQKMQLSSSK